MIEFDRTVNFGAAGADATIYTPTTGRKAKVKTIVLNTREDTSVNPVRVRLWDGPSATGTPKLDVTISDGMPWVLSLLLTFEGANIVGQVDTFVNGTSITLCGEEE